MHLYTSAPLLHFCCTSTAPSLCCSCTSHLCTSVSLYSVSAHLHLLCTCICSAPVQPPLLNPSTYSTTQHLHICTPAPPMHPCKHPAHLHTCTCTSTHNLHPCTCTSVLVNLHLCTTSTPLHLCTSISAPLHNCTCSELAQSCLINLSTYSAPHNSKSAHLHLHICTTVPLHLCTSVSAPLHLCT